MSILHLSYLLLSIVLISGIFTYLGYKMGVEVERNRAHNQIEKIFKELSRKEWP